ncbi:MAG: hypothetical protein ACE5NJ_12940 [Thermodesulfobacteriota bacterium]
MRKDLVVRNFKLVLLETGPMEVSFVVGQVTGDISVALLEAQGYFISGHRMNTCERKKSVSDNYLMLSCSPITKEHYGEPKATGG